MQGKSAVFGSRFEDINFKGDVFGGVTTAIISLPLALALVLHPEPVLRPAFGGQ